MGTLRACLHTPFWIDPGCLPIKMLLQILLEEYVRFSITSNRAMVFSLAGDVSGIVSKGRFIEIRHFSERRLHLLNSLRTRCWRAAILSSISLKMPFAHESVGFSLYVTIFPDPFNQGSAGDIPARYTLPGKDLFLHTARPIRKDRASPGSVPGPIDDWRVVASSTRYIRTREPQEWR
jgi:hypothetical protein